MELILYSIVFNFLYQLASNASPMPFFCHCNFSNMNPHSI